MAVSRYGCALVLFLFSYALAKQQGFIVRLSGEVVPLDAENQKDDEIIKQNIISSHDAILSSITAKESGEVSPLKLYSFTNVINGFVAVLTDEQAQAIASHPDVVSVMKDDKVKLQSTRSYSFLGLNKRRVGAWTKTNGTDVIIGIFDDGVWPESPSFNDEGYGPVPKKFKGICQTGKNFTKKNCNKKLIGARYFSEGYLESEGLSGFRNGFPDYISPRSYYGHGVHIASVAGGSRVPNVTIRNVKFGTARGVGYGARIAMYKICWGNPESFNGYCSVSDALAAMDAALGDGVDIFLMPLGGLSAKFFDDPIAEAAIRATVKGVVCVFPASASRAGFGTIRNSAPWIISVAASTLDRKLYNYVTLGSGKSIMGIGFNGDSKDGNTSYPLIYGDAVSFNSSNSNANYCESGSLSTSKARGKVVLCTSFFGNTATQSKEVLRVKGKGMINDEFSDIFYQQLFGYLQHSAVTASAWTEIYDYFNSAISPKIKISSTKMMVGSKKVVAPTMATFSGKGPNPDSNFVLKPDITAPGVNILGAESPKQSISKPRSNNVAAFNFSSGTSVASAHVAGAVALIKSLHPTWPPSWIHSAIVTTGTRINNQGTPILDSDRYEATPFDMGGGHLNVNAAIDPGLVFGISTMEYQQYICNFEGVSGCGNVKPLREIELNLPSLSIPNLKKTANVTRSLTLVGKPAEYTVTVKSPNGSRVVVSPTKLTFAKYGETKSFSIRIKPLVPFFDVFVNHQVSGFTFGTITWSDGVHNVIMNVAVNILEL